MYGSPALHSESAQGPKVEQRLAEHYGVLVVVVVVVVAFIAVYDALLLLNFVPFFSHIQLGPPYKDRSTSYLNIEL